MIHLHLYFKESSDCVIADAQPLLDMGWEILEICDAPVGPHPMPQVGLVGYDRYVAEMFLAAWDGDYLLHEETGNLFKDHFGPAAIGTVNLVESYFEEADLETEFGLSPVTVKKMNGHLSDSETSLSITALGGYQPRNPRKESKVLETFIAVVIIAALVFLYTLTP